MFIDFLTLLLIDLVAGFVLLAAYVAQGLGEANQRQWAPGFAMVGLVALLFGGQIVMTWPLPGSYNILFGEMAVFFGVIFLGASLALAFGWNLLSVAIFAVLPGLAAILLGARIIDLGMTTRPLLSGVAFILSGAVGVLAAPVMKYALQLHRYRVIIALTLLIPAILWAITGYGAYWSHVASFEAWRPR
ncbi:MAG: DUF981 family protein [Armatimonadota bacterium]